MKITIEGGIKPIIFDTCGDDYFRSIEIMLNVNGESIEIWMNYPHQPTKLRTIHERYKPEIDPYPLGSNTP